MSQKPGILGTVCFLCIFQAAYGQGQNPAPVPNPPPVAEKTQATQEPTPEQRIQQIQQTRQSLVEETTAVNKALEKESSQSARGKILTQQLDLLGQLDAAYAEQIAGLQDGITLADEERQYREAGSKLSETLGNGGSVSFSELDRTQEELDVLSSRKSTVEAKLDQARLQLEQARENANRKEEALDRAREDAKRSPSDHLAGERLKYLELDQRLARELVTLRKIARGDQERTEAAHGAHVDLLQQKVGMMRERAVFSDDELKKQLQQIDSDEFTLKRELSKAADQQMTTKSRLAEARDRMARASMEEQERLADEVEAKKLADEALKTKIDNLTKRIELLADWRTSWQRRYAVFNDIAGQAQWLKWKQEAADKVQAIESDERLLDLWLNDWQNRSITVENKLGSQGPDAAGLRRWLELQRRYHQDIIDGLQEHKAFIENTRRLQQKLVDSITEKTSHRTWREWMDLVLDMEVDGNKVSDWVSTATIATGLFLLLLFVRNFVITRWQHHVEEKKTPVLAQFVVSVRRTTAFFLFMMSVFVSALWLKLDPATVRFIRNLTMVALIVQAAIWLSYFFRSWIFNYLARKTKRDQASMGALAIFNFLSQAFVWSLASLLVLQNLGIDVTALVTGLGIGGVAVALALQRVLGDVLSSLSIVLDKPFLAGDFIVFGEHMGTIEQIGVKSTRIRSLSGEQIICPNSDLLNAHIRNYKRMHERRVVFHVNVVYQTSPEKLAIIPEMFRQIIESQEQIRFDRAHFSAYGDFALVFEIVYYVLSPDYNVYMDIQQDINLAIYKRFQKEGVHFAYPTQKLYLESPDRVTDDPGSALLPATKGRTSPRLAR